ncbi:hypothetical protein [Sphingomonas sp. PAMC 26621]|uniref:hypothetical protein n=1 Tax=Sphingomonas sp. PAMC 26621 TaxID=1112213 RepID=UPI0003179237|nr:hypothetical protein [Sphingomonas sp. PAMC 26621]
MVPLLVLQTGQGLGLAAPVVGNVVSVLPTPTPTPTPSPTLPAAPTLTVSPGNAQNTLTWNDGATGGAAITAHKLYAGSAPGTLTLVGTIMSASPYIETGLTNGTIRYYALSAVNSVGEGPTSAIQSATPVAGAPVPTTYPAISGTPINGNTISSTSSVWTGNPTIATNWYRDGVAMSPAVTTSTYTWNSTLDDGHFIARGDTVGGVTVFSNVMMTALRTLAYAAPLSAAPDNTSLNGYAGWTQVVGGSDTLKIQGGALVATGLSANDLWKHATAGPDHELEVYMDYVTSPLDDPGSVRLNRLRYTDANNHINVDMGYHGFTPSKKVGGVSTPLTGFINFGTLAYGSKLRFAIINGYMRMYINDAEMSQSASASGGLGLDVRDVPAVNALAIGGAQNTSSTAYPRPITRALNIYDNHVTAISVVSVVNATDPLAATSQITTTVSGTFTGTIAQLQYAVVLANGTVVTPWTNFSGISGQTYSFSATLPAGAAGPSTFYVRDASNPTSFGALNFAIPARQTIFPLRVGQQDGNYSYYSGNDYARDEVRRSDYRKGSSYVDWGYSDDGLDGVDKNGYINGYKAGESSIRMILPYYWARLGTYPIVYPNGMAAGTNNLDGNYYTIGTEYQFDTNNKARDLVVKTNYTITAGQPQSEINFSGIPTGKTATTMGFRPTMKLKGDTKPNQLVTDEVVASMAFAKSKIFRMMDARPVNNNGGTKTINNVQQFFRMSVAMAVDLCNQTGQDLWLCMFLDQTADSMRSEFDYIAANLNPGLPVHIEFVNEHWNDKFSQWYDSADRGVRAGLTISATTAGAVPITPLPLDANFNVSGSAKTATPTRAFATGDTVLGNIPGVGYQLWKALQPVTANDTNANVTAATNAYWQVVYDTNATNIARVRWVSQRLVVASNIAKAAYTAIGRDTSTLLPAFLWWAIQQVNSAIKYALDFDDNFKVIKEAGVAPYWDASASGSAMSNYSDAGFGTWTPRTKALYTTNLAACVDAFYANVTIRSTLQSTLHALGRTSWQNIWCQRA